MKKITFNRDGFTENRIGFDYADLTEDVKQKVIQEHSEFLIQTAESEEEAQFDTNYVIEHIEINGYLFDEDGDLLPIVTHVGKNNEVLKHTFGKNNYECNITDFFSDYPIQDDIWPSRRWNKARTEYIDLSGTTPVKETEPAPTPTSKEGLEDGGFTKGAIFLDEGDFDRNGEPDELYIRGRLNDETFDICNFGCNDTGFALDYATALVARYNQASTLYKKNKEQIGLLKWVVNEIETTPDELSDALLGMIKIKCNQLLTRINKD